MPTTPPPPAASPNSPAVKSTKTVRLDKDELRRHAMKLRRSHDPGAQEIGERLDRLAEKDGE